MTLHSDRTRRVALVALGLLACATSGFAAQLPATLLDPKDAPAYVSACAIDNDSSGVFTPQITVTDRRPSAVTGADVAIDFIDAQNHVVGQVVVSPPYGPEAMPFGSIDRIACRVKRATFVDGSVYAVREPSNAASSILPIAGVLIGVGAAAILIGSNHGSKSSTPQTSSSATPSPSSSASSTPVPVASIIPLGRPKKAH